MSWILLFFGVIWRFCKISSQWCFVLFQYISCLFTSKTSLNSGYSLYHNPSLPSCCKSFETSLEIWWNLVFCYQNCSDLLWEKIVLVIEKNVWNSRLKAENLQHFWDHQNNFFKQWRPVGGVKSACKDPSFAQSLIIFANSRPSASNFKRFSQ